MMELSDLPVMLRRTQHQSEQNHSPAAYAPLKQSQPFHASRLNQLFALYPHKNCKILKIHFNQSYLSQCETTNSLLKESSSDFKSTDILLPFFIISEKSGILQKFEDAL